MPQSLLTMIALGGAGEQSPVGSDLQSQTVAFTKANSSPTLQLEISPKNYSPIVRRLALARAR